MKKTVSKQPRINLQDDTGHWSCFDEADLTPCPEGSPLPLPKFKVGDKVTGWKVGEPVIGVVIGVRGEKVWVECVDKVGHPMSLETFDAKNLNPYVEPPKPKYQKGDLVVRSRDWTVQQVVSVDVYGTDAYIYMLRSVVDGGCVERQSLESGISKKVGVVTPE